jgi:hypothetical protein
MLRYSIADEMLYGTVNGMSLSMKAYSGGGRGSTAGIERTDLKHWNTGKKAPDTYDEKDRGGPLPVGFYMARYVANHPKYHRCAFLEQTLTSIVHVDPFSGTGVKVSDRDQFYIHHTGPKGSDGCIVPASDSDYRTLIAAIKAVPKGVAVLVHNDGVLWEKFEQPAILKNTA